MGGNHLVLRALELSRRVPAPEVLGDLLVAFEQVGRGQAMTQGLDGELASAEDWRAGGLTASASPTAMPARPARPVSPQLLAPRHMPRRRSAGVGGRIALLHAVAHIELNAIDLAWDLIGRFAGLDWPVAFYDDWVAVAEDEAHHFTMIEARLNELGAGYGDFPAHDGLWQAAMATAHDPLARLAVVPMLLEARGLDVTPAMIAFAVMR